MKPADQRETTCLPIALLAAATVLPWVVQFTVSWWAALLLWFALVALYDRFFVPKGRLCMGIPFMIPLCSGLALIGLDLLHLIKWAHR